MKQVAHCGQRSLDVPLAVEFGQSIPWLAGRLGTPKGHIESLIHARMRAALAELDQGDFTEGHELDRKTVGDHCQSAKPTI